MSDLYQQALDALIAEKGTDVTIADLFMLREAEASVLIEHPELEDEVSDDS
jgi:hypothetical protein